jgi:hypothetical protein
MDRITIGAALGGAAVYFLDPQRGEDRRRRVQSFWRENRDTTFEVGDEVSQAAESMRPLVRRMKRGFGRGDRTGGAEIDGSAGVDCRELLGVVPCPQFGDRLGVRQSGLGEQIGQFLKVAVVDSGRRDD